MTMDLDWNSKKVVSQYTLDLRRIIIDYFDNLPQTKTNQNIKKAMLGELRSIKSYKLLTNQSTLVLDHDKFRPIRADDPVPPQQPGCYRILENGVYEQILFCVVHSTVYIDPEKLHSNPCTIKASLLRIISRRTVQRLKLKNETRPLEYIAESLQLLIMRRAFEVDNLFVFELAQTRLKIDELEKQHNLQPSYEPSEWRREKVQRFNEYMNAAILFLLTHTDTQMTQEQCHVFAITVATILVPDIDHNWELSENATEVIDDFFNSDLEFHKLCEKILEQGKLFRTPKSNLNLVDYMQQDFGILMGDPEELFDPSLRKRLQSVN